MLGRGGGDARQRVPQPGRVKDVDADVQLAPAQLLRRGDRLLNDGADGSVRVADDPPEAARVGGDEFVLILRGGPDRTEVAEVAARIIARLEQPIRFDGQECRISGSIGVVLSAAYAPPEPERMHAEADEALYAAKRAGRGRCVVG